MAPASRNALSSPQECGLWGGQTAERIKGPARSENDRSPEIRCPQRCRGLAAPAQLANQEDICARSLLI